MKRTLHVICGVLLVAFGIYDLQTSKPKEATFIREEVPVPAQPADALATLIDRIHAPIKGQIITPKTTNELRAWFAEADLQRAVPRVYVDRLPADFAKRGDKDLFAKVISALILRENEQALKERAALILLKNKMDKNENWSEKEQDFFAEMVQKYDSKARKTVPAQMADLLVKVDAIPPMIAVIQAAEATNWGKEHLESPFEQTGWLDAKTYTRVPFDSLVAATESYAREMNGMPPLEGWRFSRVNLTGRGYEDAGTRILRWLNDYKMEDLKYTDKLYNRLDELGYEIPDALSFLKEPAFRKGTVTLNGQVFDVEVALSEVEQRRGLMFRSTLPDKTGMIFIYPVDSRLAVWMKNTFIPLDILFFDADGVIVDIAEHAKPLDETHIVPSRAVRGFLELAAGSVKRYHIKRGDKLSVNLGLNQN